MDILTLMADAYEEEIKRYLIKQEAPREYYVEEFGKNKPRSFFHSVTKVDCWRWIKKRGMAAALLAPCKKLTAEELPDYIAHWLTTIADFSP